MPSTPPAWCCRSTAARPRGAGNAMAATSAEERLATLGIALPAVPQPLGAYVPAVQSGALLFVSGMLPIVGGEAQVVGRLGRELDIEQARGAARTAALN